MLSNLGNVVVSRKNKRSNEVVPTVTPQLKNRNLKTTTCTVYNEKIHTVTSSCGNDVNDLRSREDDGFSEKLEDEREG